MERILIYSRVGVRGRSAEIENQKVIKKCKTNEKLKLLCKKAVYISTASGACSRMGAISKKNVVTRWLCFSDSKPA